MSVAIIPLSEEYSFPLAQQSLILSVFYVGYLPMQLGGAILCRRYGGKSVLSIGAFLWSLFTILTPLAASYGYYTLLIVRVFMGLSEGVAFPSVFHILASWIPAAERARSIALFLTGAHVGTTIALVLSPLIIAKFTWHMIFYSFGVLGFVWIALWHIFASNKGPLRQTPSNEYVAVSTSEAGEEMRRNKSTLTSTSIVMEVEKGKEHLSVSESTAPIFSLLTTQERNGIKFILTSRKCMAVCIAQVVLNLVHYTIIAWLPTYFKIVYSVETTNLSFTFVPYFAMALAANVGGYLADFLLLRGIHLTRVRQIVTVIANVGATIWLLLFTSAQTVNVALIYITFSLAFLSLNTGGFESSYMDLSAPSMTGIFKATCNTFGSLAGFVAIPFSTLVLYWLGDSWRAMFATLGIWIMVLCVVYCSWASSERILTEDVK